MMPAFQRQHPGPNHGVTALLTSCGCLVLFKLKRRQIAVRAGGGRLGLSCGWRTRRYELHIRLISAIANLDPLRSIEFKHVLVAGEGVPFDPAFESRDVQPPASFAGQIEVVACAV